MEYHLPQLVDIRAAAVGVSDLDDAGAPPLRHALLALHPAVRPGAVRPAVRVGHGAGARAAPARGHHEPAPAGPGPGTLPLPAPGRHGEDQGIQLHHGSCSPELSSHYIRILCCQRPASLLCSHISPRIIVSM